MLNPPRLSGTMDGMTSADTDADARLHETDAGDHDRFAHYVTPASAIVEAMVTGTPCVALCGKVWIPSRDPQRYPVCPTCAEIKRERYG